MVIPLSLAIRYRWVIRLGLMGYAATTIIGWAIQGPYFTTAYIAKAIEVTLIIVLAIDFARMDGNPVTVIKNEIASLKAQFGRRSATSSSNA
jgi:flagellar motor component MotA